MAQYGKRYKVSPCKCDGEHAGDKTQWQEINGKRGYIRLWDGPDCLELYITSIHIAARIERLYPSFKPKNHYDDATAFTFRNDPVLVASACKLIKARNRKQYTPEQRLAMAARMRSIQNKPRQNEGLRSE
jgi:hypothetical protein